MTAIVIPVADVKSDSAALLDSCLFSIFEQGLHEDRPVIVCYDSCGEGFIEHFTDRYGERITHLIHKGNRRNFAGNANMGLRHVLKTYSETPRGAVVVNQDCVLPSEQWFKACTEGGGIRVPNPVNICKEPPVTTEDLQKLEASQPEGHIQIGNHTKLVGFHMYFSPELLSKVGIFDESFVSTWEDDDICARALLAGFPVEHVPVNVHHYSSRCGSYDGHRLAKNLVKYRMKWSIPEEIEHIHMNQWILDHHVWKPEMKED